MEPMQLARRDQLLDHKFVSSAFTSVGTVLPLEIVQTSSFDKRSSIQKVVRLSQSQSEKIAQVDFFFLKDTKLVEMVFHSVDQCYFEPATFCAAITAWEDYSCKLHK